MKKKSWLAIWGRCLMEQGKATTYEKMEEQEGETFIQQRKTQNIQEKWKTIGKMDKHIREMENNAIKWKTYRENVKTYEEK